VSATNRTFGEIRFQLQKEFPGLDADVLDFWITERYRDILRSLAWRRLRVQAVIQTPDAYETGTVAVTNGSDALTLTGGTWTSAMTGRGIRIAADNEYYQFTFASSTTGTLDRNYEGTTDADATYKLFQSVYVLPADCRELHSIRVLDSPRDLDQWSQETLDEAAPHRIKYGTPRAYAPHMDNASSPSRIQVELYPIPDDVMSLPYWYTQDPTLFSASGTADFFAPWLLPNALVEQVRSLALRKERDYTGAQLASQEATVAMQEMIREEARRIGTTPLKMAGVHTRHRVERVLKRFPQGNFVLGDDF
jgi:hypothetical protein